MKKMLAVAVLSILSLGAFTSTTQARGKSVTIHSTDCEVRSGTLRDCTSYLQMDGESSGSKRILWLETYRERDFPKTDFKEVSIPLGNGDKKSHKWIANKQHGDYYLNLDPDGAYKSGCNGKGTLWD